MQLRSVTVWFGEFPSEDHLRRYLEEEFADDMGQESVDPDFLEWGWSDPPTVEPAALLEGHTASSAYLPAVDAQWSRAFPVNAVVVVFGDRVPAPRSAIGSDHVLQLIGRFGEPEG